MTIWLDIGQASLFPRRRKRLSEFELQMAVIGHLKLLATRGTIYFHVPNGEKRDKRTAAKLKAMGVLPGVADLLVLVPGMPPAGLELKAPGRTQSDDQKAFQAAWEAAGGLYAVADRIDEAVAALRDWGALKT